MAKHGLEYIESREKRVLDITVSSALIASTLPFSLAVAVEIMAERGQINPLFVQERSGKNGEPFRNFKFQSLKVRDANAKLISGSDHPDASPIGRFLRQTSLDELPQLINVASGDISMVGVRPVPQTFLEYYEMIARGNLFDEWHYWLTRNPGLTGEGQLYTKSVGNHSPRVLRRRMAIDIMAAEKASFRGDLRVIGRTPLKLFLASVN